MNRFKLIRSIFGIDEKTLFFDRIVASSLHSADGSTMWYFFDDKGKGVIKLIGCWFDNRNLITDPEHWRIEVNESF